jgi:UDP-GlcNAc:undecaprenyl-phosphate/decaprenyl-phosphate GlcNAc-1-phosphate transferase
MPTASPKDVLAALGGALLLGAVLVPLMGRLAARAGLVDRPGTAAHKAHRRTTPYGGGAAIWLSMAMAAAPLLARPGWPTEGTAALGLAATAVMALGLVDDWRPLPALPRFLVQLLVASALVGRYPQFRLPLGADVLAVPLTVLWVLALTNAFNFLDNMDGLAAGLAAIVCVALGAAAWQTGPAGPSLLIWALLGALLAFLVYNLPPASVFMGDAGGLFIGFVLSSQAAALSRQLATTGPSRAAWVVPLTVFAIPAYDLVTVTAIRLGRGAAFWKGDNNHISHRLVAAGLTRRAAVLVIYALAAATALPAVLAPWRRGWTTALWLAGTGGAALAVGLLERRARAAGRPRLDTPGPQRRD